MKNFIKKSLPIIFGLLAFAGVAAASILTVPQGGSGVNNITGIIQGNGTTPFSPITIGSGLDFTSGTLSATGGGGTVTEINTAAPITGGPITDSGTIGINQSGSASDGYLSSTDWNTFNNKLSGSASPTQVLYSDATTGAITGDANHTIDNINGITNFQENAGDYTGLVNVTGSFGHTQMRTLNNVSGTQGYVNLTAGNGVDVGSLDSSNFNSGLSVTTHQLIFQNTDGTTQSTWYWPQLDGTTGESLLTDGTGHLSWGTPTITPGSIIGTATHVPYYDAVTGALTDDANFTRDNSNNFTTLIQATNGSDATSNLQLNADGVSGSGMNATLPGGLSAYNFLGAGGSDGIFVEMGVNTPTDNGLLDFYPTHFNVSYTANQFTIDNTFGGLFSNGTSISGTHTTNGPVTFTGAGLDDMANVTTGYTSHNNNLYHVEIDGQGTGAIVILSVNPIIAPQPGEGITDTTTGATAIIKYYDGGNKLDIYNVSGSIGLGDTLTGDTSGFTEVVNTINFCDTFSWTDGTNSDSNIPMLNFNDDLTFTLSNNAQIMFGASSGHTLGDFWEFQETVTIENKFYVGNGGLANDERVDMGDLDNISNGTRLSVNIAQQFIGAASDGSFFFSNTSGLHQLNVDGTSGDVRFGSYPDSRDDTGTTTPINFLYTASDGTVQSGPLSAIGGGGNFLYGQTEGIISHPTPLNSDGETWFGVQSGSGVSSSDAVESTFIGHSAGQGAINASNAVFIGTFAGTDAQRAISTVGIGSGAGDDARDAINSQFIGNAAGASSQYAINSTFMGQSAGSNSPYAAYSIFLGKESGSVDAVNNLYRIVYSSLSGSYMVGETVQGTNGSTGVVALDTIGTLSVFNVSAAFLPGDSLTGLTSGATSNIDAVNDIGHSILIGASTSTGGFSNSIGLGTGATNTDENQFLVAPAYSTVSIGATTGQFYSDGNTTGFGNQSSDFKIQGTQSTGLFGIFHGTNELFFADVSSGTPNIFIGDASTGEITRDGGIVDARVTIVPHNATTTLTASDYDIEVSGGSLGTATINLPTSGLAVGKTYIISDYDGAASAQNIVIDAGSGNTLHYSIVSQTKTITIPGESDTIKLIDNTPGAYGWKTE